MYHRLTKKTATAAMTMTAPATMAPIIAGDNPDFALDAVAPVVSDPVDVAVFSDKDDVRVVVDDGSVDGLDNHPDGTGGGVGTLKSRAT
jgi:hypothetical protein